MEYPKLEELNNNKSTKIHAIKSLHNDSCHSYRFNVFFKVLYLLERVYLVLIIVPKVE